MKFPFGNKIPFITVVEDKGKKVPDVIVGIPGDQDWAFVRHHQEEGYIYLLGRKTGARPIWIVIAANLLNEHQKVELGII